LEGEKKVIFGYSSLILELLSAEKRFLEKLNLFL